ncbi:HNH endonuclease, partial [Xanthomonas fragariae]
LNQAARAAYQAGDIAKANALAGRAGEMMSSGYVDDIFELKNDAQKGGSFLSMFVPVGAVAKGAGALGKAARGARALNEAADAARGLEAAADIGRGTESLADAGKADELGKGVDAASAGVHVAQLSRAERYAQLIKSNKPWSWKKDFPDGEKLTAGEKAAIKREAIEKGLIPDVQFKEGTKFPDFEKAGLIEKVDNLPEELWKSGDPAQFRWLDSRIPGGKPEGFTWHHSEIPGRMELVPFGPHNIINHQGGRSPGLWAAGSR